MSPEERLLTGLINQVGQTIGVTDWFTISQEEADAFARLTDEWDPMHNDPSWASQSEFGGTIVHGFHVLAKTYSLLKQVTDLPIVTNEYAHAVNYGLDQVRFITPLRVGNRARSRITLNDVREKRRGEFRVQLRHTIEIEGDDRPFMIADTITLFVLRKVADLGKPEPSLSA